MFQSENDKYAQADEAFYEGMMQWLEMERAYELSELDIDEMERDSNEPLTEQNRIISESPLNNKDYDNSNIGA